MRVIGMLIDEMRLDSGIILRIEDKTVPLAGDLYMVRIAFITCLPLDGSDTELRSYCGDCITRKRVFEKPAVHRDELDKVKNTIKDSFLSTNLPYMNTDKFVIRLKGRTLKEMREKKEKELLRGQMEKGDDK
ncbi:MAG: hypothetical protein J7L53_01140 [Deltaproteobacteria bacterium]|nr:hypothetical protein [Deltaproteobacteria bacterium]